MIDNCRIEKQNRAKQKIVAINNWRNCNKINSSVRFVLTRVSRAVTFTVTIITDQTFPPPPPLSFPLPPTPLSPPSRFKISSDVLPAATFAADTIFFSRFEGQCLSEFSNY